MRIVICAAGLGSRLGLDLPKCLVEVGGKSIIRRQLEILTALASEIVVVIGFKKELVLRELADFAVSTAENDHYATTSVVDSIRLGMKGADEIVAVDGDVLFVREEMQQLLNTAGEVVCVKKNMSNDNPVYATIEDGKIVAFHRDDRGTGYEWAGICKVPVDCFGTPDGYVYQALEKRLPTPCLVIDSVEVDNTQDLAEANKWIRR